MVAFAADYDDDESLSLTVTVTESRSSSTPLTDSPSPVIADKVEVEVETQSGNIIHPLAFGSFRCKHNRTHAGPHNRICRVVRARIEQAKALEREADEQLKTKSTKCNGHYNSHSPSTKNVTVAGTNSTANANPISNDKNRTLRPRHMDSSNAGSVKTKNKTDAPVKKAVRMMSSQSSLESSSVPSISLSSDIGISLSSLSSLSTSRLNMGNCTTSSIGKTKAKGGKEGQRNREMSKPAAGLVQRQKPRSQPPPPPRNVSKVPKKTLQRERNLSFSDEIQSDYTPSVSESSLSIFSSSLPSIPTYSDFSLSSISELSSLVARFKGRPNTKGPQKQVVTVNKSGNPNQPTLGSKSSKSALKKQTFTPPPASRSHVIGATGNTGKIVGVLKTANTHTLTQEIGKDTRAIQQRSHTSSLMSRTPVVRKGVAFAPESDDDSVSSKHGRMSDLSITSSIWSYSESCASDRGKRRVCQDKYTVEMKAQVVQYMIQKLAENDDLGDEDGDETTKQIIVDLDRNTTLNAKSTVSQSLDEINRRWSQEHPDGSMTHQVRRKTCSFVV